MDGVKITKKTLHQLVSKLDPFEKVRIMEKLANSEVDLLELLYCFLLVLDPKRVQSAVRKIKKEEIKRENLFPAVESTLIQYMVAKETLPKIEDPVDPAEKIEIMKLYARSGYTPKKLILLFLTILYPENGMEVFRIIKEKTKVEPSVSAAA